MEGWCQDGRYLYGRSWGGVRLVVDDGAALGMWGLLVGWEIWS